MTIENLTIEILTTEIVTTEIVTTGVLTTGALTTGVLTSEVLITGMCAVNELFDCIRVKLYKQSLHVKLDLLSKTGYGRMTLIT